MNLIQQLVIKKFIDREQAVSLELEIKSSGKKIEEIIHERQLVSEKAFFKLKSENLKIPLKEIVSENIPLMILELISEESSKHYKMIPLGKEENVLEIGMVYPEDLNAQEALKFLIRQGRFSFQIFLITLTTFNNLLKQRRTLEREVGTAVKELETVAEKERDTTRERFILTTESEEIREEAPITKIVAVILRHAVDGQASDVHIEPGREKLRIRFRLLGDLYASIFLPLKTHLAIVGRIKIMSNLKMDETRIPQDGRFSAKINDKDVDFRVSTFPTILGEKIVLRILDPNIGLKSLAELGMGERNIEIIKKALERPFGLILVTGPTGCGKTTTLYAALQYLNKEKVNIITLEDPVEYFINNVSQSQIMPEIGYTFARGLRHTVRQDPDIIMVGEIRDAETASLAIHATLTGHVVLSTIHTTNAIGVIPRFVDLGIEAFLIPHTLNMIIAQRLIRKLCSKCREKTKPEKEVKDLILKEIEGWSAKSKKMINIVPDFSIYKAVGCSVCSQTGYSDRTIISEILLMTDQLAEIISRTLSEAEISKEAARQEMFTMRQDGIFKTLDGVTTIEEVLRVTEQD